MPRKAKPTPGEASDHHLRDLLREHERPAQGDREPAAADRPARGAP